MRKSGLENGLDHDKLETAIFLGDSLSGMSFLVKLKPKFWDHHDVASGPHTGLFDFRQKWRMIVVLSLIVTLTPLAIMMFVDYRLTQATMEEQLLVRTSSLVSSTWRTVSYFIEERKAAMKFVLLDNTVEQLNAPGRLDEILMNLQKGIGGFVDIGLVDSDGRLDTYAGPYRKEGDSLCDESCFKAVIKHGEFVSGLDRKDAGRSHQLVIAIKQEMPNGQFLVLRAAIDTKKLSKSLADLDIGEQDDAFLIDGNGILQTPSRRHGGVLSKFNLPVPDFSLTTRVIETTTVDVEPIILGYAYIPGTSIALMILRQKGQLLHLWYKPRIELVGFLALSIAGVLFAVLAMATFLVHRIHVADQKRVNALHQVEYANKLTSIERLAAGIAHEINNPLAVINQKAGLMSDLIHIGEITSQDERLVGLLDTISVSVKRCGKITQRLLNFARQIDVSIQPVELGELIQGMVDFIANEAKNRGIDVEVIIPDDLPPIESDPSHLQQIFLNIINNGFAAMGQGGHLSIVLSTQNGSDIQVSFEDNGCGISRDDLKRVFEPFFTTKSQTGGTGLGLSITHGLVQKIGGRIRVESKTDRGTRFVLTLPVNAPNLESDSREQ
jgi:two-component system, NtrC family, sensor kinase